MLKTTLAAALGAALLTGVAVAEPVTRTTTVDGPRYDGTRVVVRDKAAGTYSRDVDVKRASDGATASRDYDRVRTDNGVTASGSATGFAGKTRGFDYTRTRTEDGYTESGTATGRGGKSATLSGGATRTDSGYTRDRTITGQEGRTLYDRSVVATRQDGQVSRNVDVTRATGFHPRKKFNRRAR